MPIDNEQSIGHNIGQQQDKKPKFGIKINPKSNDLRKEKEIETIWKLKKNIVHSNKLRTNKGKRNKSIYNLYRIQVQTP